MDYSIVIPVYNEVDTIEELVARVQAVDLEKELILVNDCSTDGTGDKLALLSQAENIRVVNHERNQGQGSGTAHRLRRGHRRYRDHPGC